MRNPYVIGPYVTGRKYYANWLAGDGAALAARPAPISDLAMQTALDGRETQETHFLRTQLNAQRGRLIELEAIRARDLLEVSPQVLAEIDQHLYHIRRLRTMAEGLES